jgi:Subtilase family
VTQGAVALVEIARPGVRRSFCIATTATDFPPDRPSTWSGALDQVAAGSMPGDQANSVPASERPKRLVLAATGNVSGGMMVDVVPSQPLEDPAQSWNALTIGGFTRKEQPPAPPPDLEPVVPANNRSPFSRGSQSPPDDLTPIKPEVLFEAGNMLSDVSGFCGWEPSVSLLAPGSDVVAEPLVPFWATSAAVGMAGNFTGRLQAAGCAAGPLAGDAPRPCSRLGTVAATDPEKIHRAWCELEERIKGRETANPARGGLRCARHRARHPLCKQ